MDYRIVYLNAQFVFGVLFVLLFILERINRKGKMPWKLAGLYSCFIVSLILDSTWIMIDGIAEYRTANTIVNLVYLSIMAVVGYLWFLYTLDMFPSKTRLRRLKLFFAIPVIIDLILVISSPKTGWVFTVDEAGFYVRAPLHLISFTINYSYTLLGSYVAIVARKEAQLTTDRRRLAVAAFFPLPILVLTTIQLMLPPGLPAFQGGVLISLLLLYATHQHALVTRDTLTSLPNRFAFEADLVDRIKDYRGDSHLYLLEGDLDGFKKINDTMGHPAGDRILIAAGEVLTRVFYPYGSLVFRVGGDEFMMIVETADHLDADALRKELNSELAKAGNPLCDNLSMSLGVAEYTADSNFKSLIEKVDVDLYRVKSGE